MLIREARFSVRHHIRCANGAGAIVRFLIPAYLKYAEGKLLAAITVMRYISDNITVSVPFIFHQDMKE